MSKSTVSGFMLHLIGVTILPEVLKRLSEGELVTHTQRYFLAKDIQYCALSTIEEDIPQNLILVK